MISFKYKKNIIKFIIYISIVFVILFLIVKLFYKEIPKDNDTIHKSTIEYNDELTSIHVEYPRFNNDNINKSITNILYSYIRDFKSNEESKLLDITYELYYMDDYININFNIENTLNNIKNKNILVNTKRNEISYITALYDEEYLRNEIDNLVFYKYSQNIYNKIKDENINNFTYIIDDNKMSIYFNNINFNGIDYIPYVDLNFIEEITYIDSLDKSKKYIAFTYDDGPSEYTTEILKTLEANKSSATFFMLGNRMKANKSLVLNIYNSDSEIGSHSYSHKDLAALDDIELQNELNTTQIIYNNITNDNIKLLRPPYGRYNNNLLNQNYEIVLWNIDPKDWLIKNSDTIYNNVIKNACDGCIVLMHDIYPQTIEATKKIIPALKQKGYEIVSISKLKEIKNFKYDNKPISIIK